MRKRITNKCAAIILILFAAIFSSDGWSQQISDQTATTKDKSAKKPKKKDASSVIINQDSISPNSIVPIGSTYFAPVCGELATGGTPVGGGEIVDIVNTFKDTPTTAFIRLSAKENAPVDYKISSTDTSLVQVGLNETSMGSEVTVTVRTGDLETTPPFLIKGLRVGALPLKIQRQPDSVYYAYDWPVNVWDFDEQKDLVDYGDLGGGNVCYDPNNPPTLKAGFERIVCGQKPRYVAADGTTRLLLRVRSGMSGRACFQAVPDPEGKDVGHTDPTTIDSDAQLSYPNYTFGTYIAPDAFDSINGEIERTVNLEIAFAPKMLSKRTTTLAIRRKIKIKRPPVLLVHGFNGNTTSGWKEPFTKPAPENGWVVYFMDYKQYHSESLAEIIQQPLVVKSFKSLLDKMHDEKVAATKVDILAHSYGGLIIRAFERGRSEEYKVPDNFSEGYGHRMITLGTPHYGSQLANLVVHLQSRFPQKLKKVNEHFPVDRGGLCDLAENSSALSQLGESHIPTMTISGNANNNGLGALWLADLFLFNITDNVELENFQRHVEPYGFKEENDYVVTVTSQSGGLDDTRFYAAHSIVPLANYVAPGITGSQEVADFAFERLQLSHAAFSMLQSPLSTGEGDTRDLTIGYDHTVQKDEYAVYCGPLGDLMQ
jgi:hypothetical protein